MKVWPERDHSEERLERTRVGMATAQLFLAVFLILFTVWLIDYTKSVRDLHSEFRKDVGALRVAGGSNE